MGTEAKELNGLLSLKSVMQQGVFQDCDHFEVVLQNALFDELKISPEGTCLLSPIIYVHHLLRFDRTSLVAERETMESKRKQRENNPTRV